MDIQRELKKDLTGNKNSYIIKTMILPIIYPRLTWRESTKSKNFKARFDFYSNFVFSLVKENLGKVLTKATSFYEVAFLF